jgi:hypothetical protein
VSGAVSWPECIPVVMTLGLWVLVEALLRLVCLVVFDALLLELEGGTYARVSVNEVRVLPLTQRTRGLWGSFDSSTLICMLVSRESRMRSIVCLQSCIGSHVVEFVDEEGSKRYVKLGLSSMDARTISSPSSLPQTSVETSKKGKMKK